MNGRRRCSRRGPPWLASLAPHHPSSCRVAQAGGRALSRRGRNPGLAGRHRPGPLGARCRPPRDPRAAGPWRFLGTI